MEHNFSGNPHAAAGVSRERLWQTPIGAQISVAAKPEAVRAIDFRRDFGNKIRLAVALGLLRNGECSIKAAIS